MTYLQLFWSMFQIGLFSVGGGYVAIPLIQRQIVALHGWMTAAEFADIITISEMTPGPIAINCATFVGVRVAGPLGALVATFACVLPSCLIVILLAKIFYRYKNLNAVQYVLSGLRPVVVAMIASAGFGLSILVFFVNGQPLFAAGNVRYGSIAIFAAAMIAQRKWKVNPLYIMGGAGLCGIIEYMVKGA